MECPKGVNMNWVKGAEVYVFLHAGEKSESRNKGKELPPGVEGE